MSFESNNFKVVRKSCLPKSELNLNCTVTAEGEIARVQAVSISAFDDNQEVSEGSITFTGHVDVCMIYSLENGEIDSAFASCPFSSKFSSDEISGGERAIIKLRVVDHSIDAVSGNEAKIGISLEQSGILISSEEVSGLSSTDDDVCLREDEISVVKFVGSASSQVSETIEHSHRQKIKKVLGTETGVIVRNAEPGVNFVSVSGDVFARILFVDEDDRFDSVQLFDSFKEELEIEGVTRESMVEAFARTNNSGVKVEIEDEERGSKLVATLPFEVTAFAYEEISVKTIEDLYSLTHEVEISTESFNMSRLLPIEFVEGKIDGSLSLDESQPRVDKILFTFGSSAEVTNTAVSNGELTIEGIAKTSVVYLNDESGTISSVELEVPFSISDKSKATEESIVSVDAILTDVDVAVKKGRELFFDGKIKAIVTLSEDAVSAVITGATLGEEIPERDYAMQVVFAKEGDSLWDVAKASRARESDIARQNPELSFPLAENSDVLIFYQNAKI